MKKKILAIMLAVVLAVAAMPLSLSAYDRSITVTINGNAVYFPDQQPIIVDGRTLVPVRGVFESLGFGIEWQDSTRTVFLANAYHAVIIRIGNSIFVTNGVTYGLDVPARLIGERTMLPLRAVLESVGVAVDWCGYTWTVLIRTY